MIVICLVTLLLGCLLLWRFARTKQEHHFQLETAVPSAGPNFGVALYQSLGVRVVGGHQVSLLENGAVFDALVQDVRQARNTLHLLLYIWEKGALSDRLSRVLQERARAGVECRIVVDDFGSPDFVRDVRPALARAGCDVRVFRPVPGHSIVARNHRKLVIIDGSLAYTGGFGIRDNWLGDGIHDESWRDTSVRFSGPVVAEAQLAFSESWQEAGGPLLPREAFPQLGQAEVPVTADSTWAAFVASTGSTELTRAERLTQLMIAAAKRSVWIENAYFVPSHAISELLSRQAERGVDVRLLVPGKKSDSKTSFGAQHAEFGGLIKRGVRVFQYQPAMLHAKTMVIDSVLSQVGSINLDPLSLGHLEEDALVVQDPVMGESLRQAFTADCRHSEEQH